MEPLGFFAPEPVGTKVEEDEDRDQLKGRSSKWRGEPKEDASDRGDQENGVEEKMFGH